MRAQIGCFRAEIGNCQASIGKNRVEIANFWVEIGKSRALSFVGATE
jgi:hypothetical protein